jgi:hypothetical protein
MGSTALAEYMRTEDIGPRRLAIRPSGFRYLADRVSPWSLPSLPAIALHAAGNAGSADVSWLDQALRSLVQDVAEAEGARLPDVIAVCMTDDVLTLVLASPASQAPEPWTVDQAGTRWSIRRGDPLP